MYRIACQHSTGGQQVHLFDAAICCLYFHSFSIICRISPTIVVESPPSCIISPYFPSFCAASPKQTLPTWLFSGASKTPIWSISWLTSSTCPSGSYMEPVSLTWQQWFWCTCGSMVRGCCKIRKSKKEEKVNSVLCDLLNYGGWAVSQIFFCLLLVRWQGPCPTFIVSVKVSIFSKQTT